MFAFLCAISYSLVCCIVVFCTCLPLCSCYFFDCIYSSIVLFCLHTIECCSFCLFFLMARILLFLFVLFDFCFVFYFLHVFCLCFLFAFLFVFFVFFVCFFCSFVFFPCFFLVVFLFFVPQIAIAKGVLTPNKGGGRRTTLADWTWHYGAIAGCSGRGATAGCHRSAPLNVLWLGRRVTTNFGGVDVVPLQGAIVVCYGWGGGWRPTLGEWTWCHCKVPL